MACHQVPVGIHIWKPGPECALQHTVPTLPVNPTPRTPLCQSRTRVQVGQDRLESDPRRSTWPRGQEVQVRIEGGPESCRFTQGVSTCQRRKHQCVKRRMRGAISKVSISRISPPQCPDRWSWGGCQEPSRSSCGSMWPFWRWWWRLDLRFWGKVLPVSHPLTTWVPIPRTCACPFLGMKSNQHL